MSYEARGLDTRVGRWLSIDPHARKYPSLSPYTVLGDNPINVIDPDGRDIVVLNNPNGASGYGHMAALVGNDKTGWIFISKEGRQKDHWYSNEGTGGPALPPKIRVFTSLDAFRQAQKQDKDLGAYTQDVRFATTPEQDKKVSATIEKSARSWYNVIFSNCGDAVSDGLKKAELDPGNVTDDGGLYPVTTTPAKPNDRMKAIKKITLIKLFQQTNNLHQVQQIIILQTQIIKMVEMARHLRLIKSVLIITLINLLSCNSIGYKNPQQVSKDIAGSKRNDVFVRKLRISDIIVLDTTVKFPFNEVWEEKHQNLTLDKSGKEVVQIDDSSAHLIVFSLNNANSFLTLDNFNSMKWIMWDSLQHSIGVTDDMLNMSARDFKNGILTLTIYKTKTPNDFKNNLTPLIKFGIGN